MKTKEELKKLSNATGEAERAYHKAIFDNLKESGKEHGVEADWEDEDSKGIHLTVIGRHDDAIVIEIDKVRFNPEKGLHGAIEAHVCSEDYDDCDYWMMAFELGDDADYLYDNIIW
jgi:hypothetical protein